MRNFSRYTTTGLVQGAYHWGNNVQNMLSWLNVNILVNFIGKLLLLLPVQPPLDTHRSLATSLIHLCIGWGI